MHCVKANFKRTSVKIRFGDLPATWFFIKHSSEISPQNFFATNAGFLKGKTADLYPDSQNKILYKFFMAKKKKNFFLYFAYKRLWESIKNILGIYPAKKEFSGNRLLDHYGFNVAHPLGLGFAISPSAQYRCLLMLQNIQNAATLKEVLTTEGDPVRLEFIRKGIIKDIGRMIENKIRFRDFTVNNILIDPLNTIYWIDCRADKYFFEFLYQKAKIQMLKRFIGSFRQAANAPQATIDAFTNAMSDLIK